MVDTAAPMAMGVEAGPPDAKRMRIAEGTAGGFDVNGGRLPVPSLADGLEPIGEEVEEDTDSEEASNKKFQDYKCKPRRKATQKPVGADQKRQAFSKRKRGIVLKAYQLYKLTDAKVFMFVVNDKGSSWSYASPGFGSALQTGHMRHMRELAGLPPTPKHVTEVMAHPKMDEQDRLLDDRHVYLHGNAMQVSISHADIGNGSMGFEGPAAGTRYRQSGPAPPPAIAPPAAPPALPMYKPTPPVIRQGQPPHMPPPPPMAPPAIPLPGAQSAPMTLPLPTSMGMGAMGPPPVIQPDMMRASRGSGPAKFQHLHLRLGDHEVEGVDLMGLGDSIITPSGNKLAAAVGIHLGSLLPAKGMGAVRDRAEASGTHPPTTGSGSGTSEQGTHAQPQSVAQGGDASNSISGHIGQMITDDAGNIYRIVRDTSMDMPPPPVSPKPLAAPAPVPAPTKQEQVGNGADAAQATSAANALATLADAAAAQSQRSPALGPPMGGGMDANYSAYGSHQLTQYLPQSQATYFPQFAPPPGYAFDQYGQIVMLPQAEWQHA